MKQKRVFTAALLIASALSAFAQYDENTENGVISLADHRGFALQSKDGAFSFKPYLMVQTAGKFNWYDDEGLDKAYNQDNVANSGFAIPYAVLGFTGKAFGKVTYNLSINAAASGGGILQQAWIDVKAHEAAQFRIGKFKTPFSHAYLTLLGETMFPVVPTSLTAPVIMPYSLNAVTPNIATGFDLGVMIHGMAGKWFGYEAGLFNGTGASINVANKTFSDDWHIPSLLYACRLSAQPYGVMASSQGNPNSLNDHKMLVALSASLNVESENESTNDLRTGLEFAFQHHRLNLEAELYYMHVSFTKRQKIDETYHYLGWYAQAGFFATPSLQLALRYDFMDRNSCGKDGLLNMPAAGVNYFIRNCNLKLQAMYQYTGRTRHETQLDRDQDNLGLATHHATLQLQYSF